MSEQANTTASSTGSFLDTPLDRVDRGGPLPGLARRRPRSPRPSRRFLAGVSVFLGLWLAAALALVALPRSQAAARPYSVAGLRADLAHYPGAWSGHVIRVQGILEGPFVFCGEIRPCPPPTLGLIDTEDQIVAPDRYLPVTTEAEATSLRLIHQIPLLGSFVPAPQPLQFGRMAVYTLRLVGNPALCSRNPAVLCYEGVVLAAE